MAQAPRDQNRVTSVLGTSNADGTTTLPVYVDSATNRLLVSGVGGGGTSAVDDAAFVAGSGAGTPIMGFATSDSVDANDVGVVAMTTARALHVAVQSGGTTQYAEDTAHTTGDMGTMPLAVRNNTLGSLVSNDLDYAPLQVTSTGSLYVDLKGSDVIQQEDTAHNSGDLGFMTLGVRVSGGGSLTTADGDYNPLQILDDGGLLTADLTVSKAEDVAHTTGDRGYMALAVRNDTPSALATSDGDYIPLTTSSTGLLHTAAYQYASDGTALNHSGGNLLVNVQNFAVGQFGNTDGTAANLTSALAFSENLIYDDVAGDWNRAREIKDTLDSTGVGIQAVGMVAQFDDVAPTAVTENQFGNVRMSAESYLYTEIRDAAGNERGMVVDASGYITANINGTVSVDLGANNDVDLNTGTNAIGRVGHDVTGIGDGVTTVTTAGTDVALASSTACKKVDIQAQTDNTGLIAVGATGVDATEATGTGIILYPGDVYSLEIDNLSSIFIDSTVDGEGVRYTYFT